MIAFTEELRLAVTMMNNGDKIPDELRNRALEDLKVSMMEYQEGDAKFIILDMLKKAIENDDHDMLGKAKKYSASIVELEDIQLDAESRVLASISTEATMRFVKEEDEPIRLQIIGALANENLIPVYYEPGFLVLYNGIDHFLFGCSINDSFNKKSLADKTSNVSYETLEAIHKFSEQDSVKFRFANLSYKRKADKQYELKLEEI